MSKFTAGLDSLPSIDALIHENGHVWEYQQKEVGREGQHVSYEFWHRCTRCGAETKHQGVTQIEYPGMPGRLRSFWFREVYSGDNGRRIPLVEYYGGMSKDSIADGSKWCMSGWTVRSWLFYLNAILRPMGIVLVKRTLGRRTVGFFFDRASKHPLTKESK
jgi:hypothetical protein